MAEGDGAKAAESQHCSLMEEAVGFVTDQRYQLRKAIAHSDSKGAIRHALCLANELRSSKLSPEKYYKVYILVFWELQQLGSFLAEGSREQRLDLSSVYENVQYEGNVLPRLYLLVTVGAVFLRVAGGQAREYLDDLAWMLTSVQHPIRGLFLRYYFLQNIKDALPSFGMEVALKFLLENLRESVSLWARLRLLGPGGGALPIADVAMQLDPTRHTMRLLVAAHFVHMARLPELTVESYTEAILPRALHCCVSCEDPAGQAYMLQCFVEAFPDSFHLHTLARVLAACAQVQWAVDIRHLLEHLLRTLTAHVLEERRAEEHRGRRPGSRGPSPERGEGAGDDSPAVDLFAVFHTHMRQLQSRPACPATPLASLLQLQLRLAMAGMALHPGDAERVTLVLAGTVALLQQRREAPKDDVSARALADLLAVPLTKEALVPAVLAMPHHAALVRSLDSHGQHTAALAMVEALLEGNVSLGDLETLRRLLPLIGPLIRDECPDDAEDAEFQQKHLEHDPAAFAAEQEKMARLVHQVRHQDPTMAFQMLLVVHKALKQGGPHRLVVTLPAMATAMLRLLRPTFASSTEGGGDASAVQDVCGVVHDIITCCGSLRPQDSLRLWLLAGATVMDLAATPGQAADKTLLRVCNGYLDAAFACLDQSPWSDRERLMGLQLITGLLLRAACLGERFRRIADSALAVVRRFASQELQSRGFCLCTALFWCPACKDPSQAMSCLQQALRCADSALHVDPTQVGLFVDVVDQAISMFDDNKEVTPVFLSSLIALSSQHLAFIDNRAPEEAVRALRSSTKLLRARRQAATAALSGAVTRGKTQAESTVDVDPSDEASASGVDMEEFKVHARYMLLSMESLSGPPN